MALVRPFRGLRAVASRVDPAALLAPVDIDDDAARALLAREPRNVVALALHPPARARFLVAEQLRAGVLVHDAVPALYVLKAQGGAVGFFALVDAGSVAGVAADVDDDANDADAGYDVDAAVLRYADKKGRIARSLESETEREPDAAFAFGGTNYELWAVDDDSAAARVTTLLESADVDVAHGAARLARRRSKASDDGAGFALAFFVDQEDTAAVPPRGCVLAPRQTARL
jgi:hypothetical protein